MALQGVTIIRGNIEYWTLAMGWLKYLYEPWLYTGRGHTLLEDIDGTLHEVKEEIGDKLIKIPRLVI